MRESDGKDIEMKYTLESLCLQLRLFQGEAEGCSVIPRRWLRDALNHCSHLLPRPDTPPAWKGMHHHDSTATHQCARVIATCPEYEGEEAQRDHSSCFGETNG